MTENRNFARFWHLLSIIPLGGLTPQEFKQQIVSEFTAGRTDSLRQTTPAEFRDIITRLEALYDRARDSRHALRRARSQSLHLLQQIGVDTHSWPDINRFCLSPRIAGAEFGELSFQQQLDLAKRLRMILKKQTAPAPLPP